MDPPLATLGDSALIKMVLSGRTDCFAVLMNRYLPIVRRRIGSIVANTADVEDLSQEVFFKVWHHLSAFREESAFSTWVGRIAVNEALNLCRQNERRPNWHIVEDLDTFASAIDSPLQCLAQSEAREILHSAVAELPVIYRRVLILRDFEESSMEEIARLVRSTIPAVKTRLFRARVMLLQLLQANVSGVGSEASECVRQDPPPLTIGRWRQLSGRALSCSSQIRGHRGKRRN
jgi:RNA polymerase sigma-70 factor, ECF subfamily